MTQAAIASHVDETARILTTRSGLRLEVVPATEHDGPALAQFFEKVSEQDRRFRFLAACAQVSREQLDLLTHPDHFRTESFLVFEPVYGDLVASALLAQEAQRRGVRRVISIESRENRAAIELEREKGFTPYPFEGDPTLVILSKTYR